MANKFACTFRNYLCAEPGCGEYAMEPGRRASCENDVHTPYCLTNLTLALRERIDGRLPAEAVPAANPLLPPEMHRAPPSTEPGAELGYCFRHSAPSTRQAKAEFWESCLGPRANMEDKERFLAENPDYVEAVRKYRAGVDLKGLLKMSSEV